MATLGSMFRPASNLRGLFAGSGGSALNDARMCAAVLDLVPADAASGRAARVLYLGTATYDLPGPQKTQTSRFEEAGCEVRALQCVEKVPGDMAAAVEWADVVLISGGNTLFAIDRWARVGLTPLLRGAMDRGVVMAGGSAGAICWFDGGHSDSNDPDSFKKAMLAEAAGTSEAADDESSKAPESTEETKPWKYIRTPALGFLPGLMCPHHDSTQSNGVLRATDFDAMMLRHAGERGICVDHWAALVVKGDSYNVISLDDKPGSVLDDGSYSAAREGKPGMWIKDVVDGAVKTRRATEGKLSDLLCSATEIVQDPACDDCRAANPDDGEV